MTDDTISVRTKRCFSCATTSVVVLDRAAFEAWQSGTFVQVAFPHLSAEDRELLISGTHPACWDAMFADNEEN